MRYFFRFTSPTRLAGSSWKTHQKWEQKIIKVNYPKENITMLIFDKRIKKGKVYLHYGLGIDIELTAENKEKGKAKAENIALNFLSLITYLENCYADIPVLTLSYRKPEKDLWLEDYQGLVADSSYRPVETSLRDINLSRLDSFIKKMKSVDLEVRDKIDNALHWFWKALGSRDVRDRFINLWIGLEFLEGPLKRHFSLVSGSMRKKPICSECHKEFSVLCPKCKKDYYYSAEVGKTGFKKLEKSISEKIMKFSQLHSFRSNLFHSNVNASMKSRKEYDKVIYSTRVLFNYAIFTLLGLNLTNAVPLAKSGMRTLSLPMAMEFRGRIKVKETVGIDDIEKQPSVRGEYSFDFEFKDEDIITLGDVEHTFEGVFETGQVKKVLKEDSSHNVKEVWERK